MTEREHHSSNIHDLDPPRSRWQTLAVVALWLVIAAIVIAPFRLLLADGSSPGAAADVPKDYGLARLCFEFTIPSMLDDLASLAYPIWNNVCTFVGR